MFSQSQILSLVGSLSTANTQTKTLGKMVHIALYGTQTLFSATVDSHDITLQPIAARLLYDRRVSELNRREAEIVIAKLSFITQNYVDNHIGSPLCLHGAGFELFGRLHKNKSNQWLREFTGHSHVSITLNSITQSKRCEYCELNTARRKSIHIQVGRESK